MLLLCSLMFIIMLPAQGLSQDRNQDRLGEYVMMKDGQMYLIRDNEQIQIREQLRLKNGTLVNTGGTYQLQNGRKLRLRDGSYLDMDGNRYRSQEFMRNKMQKRDRMDQRRMDRKNGRGSGTRPGRQ